MRLLLNIHARFQGKAGAVFSHHLTYKRFWRRYAEVFEEVVVLARVQSVETVSAGWEEATGPGVGFCPLPYYNGPWGLLQKFRRIKAVMRQAASECDVCLLRLPADVGMPIWKSLPAGMPLAVEVVADPWEALGPAAASVRGRALFRRLLTSQMRAICRHASAALYVTQRVLQERYPPAEGAYTVGCSDVHLPPEVFAGPELLAARRRRWLEWKASPPARAIRLGFVGDLSTPVKAADVMIAAAAACRRAGLPVELTFVGEGRLLPMLEALAGRAGIGPQVRFLGRLPAGGAVIEALDTFDLFLLVSHSEGLPRALVEAMARGCPAVGSCVGGITELLGADCLVPPGDARALTVKITEIVSDYDRLCRLSRDNHAKAREFAADVLDHRRREFYRKVRQLAGNAPPAGRRRQ